MIWTAYNLRDWYLHKNLPLKSQSRLHSFNNFFFTKVVENDVISTESERRKAAFERVRKWIGEVNMFEKDYVFIPINQRQAQGPTLYFASGFGGSFVVHAWKERCPDPTVDQLLEMSQMKYIEVKVPQQDNDYDCGIYLLHFVDLFLFQSLAGNFEPNQWSLFATLWDGSEVLVKRKKIRDLIRELNLVSWRRSQEQEVLRSRLSRIQSCAVPQPASVEELMGCLVGDEGRVDRFPKRLNIAGATESMHQTTEDVKLDDIQHRTGVVHLRHHQGTVLDEHIACAALKSTMERSKRRNWSSNETSILLGCKKEGGRFSKPGNQAMTTDWNAISQEIGSQISPNNNPPLTGDQARLRYDTLLKAFKRSNLYCMTNRKPFSELRPDELGNLKLATTLTHDWYNVLDEINCQKQAQSSKRMKHTLSGVDDTRTQDEACSDSSCSGEINFYGGSAEPAAHVIPTTTLGELDPSPVTAEPFMLRGLPDPITGGGGGGDGIFSLDDCGLPYTAISSEGVQATPDGMVVDLRQQPAVLRISLYTRRWTLLHRQDFEDAEKVRYGGAAQVSEGAQRHRHDSMGYWQFVLAASVAGTVELASLFPLDTVKTRMQMLQGAGDREHMSTVSKALSAIVRKEGLLGLSRGLGAMGLGSVAAHAVYFGLYLKFQEHLLPHDRPLGYLNLIGTVEAAIASDFVFTPLDMVKQRLQLRHSPYVGLIDCIKKTMKNEGIRAFYRSCRTTVVLRLSSSVFHFAAYEACKSILANIDPEYANEDRLLFHATAGAAAGALSSAVTTPLDVIKTRLQCQGVNGASRYASGSVLAAARSIVKQEGSSALWKGIRPRILFHTPGAAICWSAYEASKSFFLGWNEAEPCGDFPVRIESGLVSTYKKSKCITGPTIQSMFKSMTF